MTVLEKLQSEIRTQIDYKEKQLFRRIVSLESKKAVQGDES
jgi:hypothetical protein